MTTVLLIGGMDSSGGAGLLRDCATVKAVGLTARVAVTAVTAQNDSRVGAVHPVPVDVIENQIAIAGPVDGVKIGMLGTRDAVMAVVRCLPPVPVVLDPVMVSSSGHALLDHDAAAPLLDRLAPKATLITPNRPELSAIADVLGTSDPIGWLIGKGCAVLVKDGHGTDPQTCTDVLYTANHEVAFSAPRFAGTIRGTGCALASGIAAGLACGRPVEDAIRAARDALRQRFQRELFQKVTENAAGFTAV